VRYIVTADGDPIATCTGEKGTCEYAFDTCGGVLFCARRGRVADTKRVRARAARNPPRYVATLLSRRIGGDQYLLTEEGVR